jgi:histone-lysine N-methyltransferase SETMAR
MLLHHSAHPHIAAHTVETFWKLWFEVFGHPLYSSDLAPSDFHLFGLLKDALRGRCFASYHELKGAVHKWLATQLKTSFSYGIHKPVQHSTKCIESKGAVLINCIQ